MGKEDGVLLKMEKISKGFGAVVALQEVTLALNHHEVLGLVGDNGAGKSTLMKILSGAIPMDEGQIFFEGKEVIIESPQDARNLGIETIYQNFALVGNLPIYLNIFLGRYRVKSVLGGLIKILDEMALGAIEAIDAAKRLKEIKVSGFDGNNDAMKSIAEGRLVITGAQRPDAQGYWSVLGARMFLEGYPVPQEMYVPCPAVDKSNVAEYLKRIGK